MELILWRHAEAEDGAPDIARELTAKGHKQATKMAEFLRPRLPENTRILVSPARRTQQTVHALTKHFETEPDAGTGERSPGREGLRLQAGHGFEPALVEDLRGEAAQVRVQPPGVLQEEAAVRRHGDVLAQDVTQGRGLRAGPRPGARLVQ